MEKLIRCYHPDGTHEDISDTLALEEICRRLNGWVEVHKTDGLVIMCDEEGKIKGLPVCGHTAPHTFVGDLYVGELCAKGLRPTSSAKIKAFETGFRQV